MNQPELLGALKALREKQWDVIDQALNALGEIRRIEARLTGENDTLGYIHAIQDVVSMIFHRVNPSSSARTIIEITLDNLEHEERNKVVPLRKDKEQ